MMRTVWACSNAKGEVFDHWYTDRPDDVAKRNGGSALGPFKADIPPPPTDMAPMFTKCAWRYDERGFHTILVWYL
jgi:hypothetical protein